MDKDVIRFNSSAIKKMFAEFDSIEKNGRYLLEHFGRTINGRVYLTSEQMCDFFKITHRTLQNYRLKRIVPYSNIGGKYYYPLAEIYSLLEKNKITEIDY